MSDVRPPRHGLGDPRIPWVVILDVTTESAPDQAALGERLADLALEAGWPAPSSSAVVTGADDDLLERLAADGSEALRLGVRGDGLVLAARHDALDGLAVLVAARRLLGSDLRSSARGVGPDRGRAGGALLSRAWEVAVRPPARVATTGEPTATGDSFASTTVPGRPRTADLVHAGAHAVCTWNVAHHVGARRVSVAVGVSTVGGASDTLADHSGFLRLRGVERLDIDEIRDLLAHAPLQPGGGDSSGRGPVAALARIAVRAAAPRLGSTLLVSHLGEVAAPANVERLAFYPVTGGGSGLSLGAATVRGRTTLTLRGRAAQHDDESLQGLLALVVERLA